MKKLASLFLILFLFVACRTDRSEKRPNEDRDKPKETAKSVAATDKTISDYIEIEGSRSGYVLKDGGKLYLARKGNAAQIWFESADKSAAKQITNQKEAVEAYFLSPDETKLIFLISEGGNEQYDFYLYTFETGKTEPLLVDENARYENPVWINENEFLFASNEVNKKDFYLYHFDIATKKKSLIVEKSGYNRLSDAVSKDEFLFYASFSNAKSVPYYFKNGKSKRLPISDKEKRYLPVAFFEDGILMKTNEFDDMEYLEIWKGDKKIPLFKDSWGVESVKIDKKTRKSAAFCTNQEGLSACYYYQNGKIESLENLHSVVSLSNFSNGKLTFDLMRPDLVTTPQVIDLTTKKISKFGYEFYNGIDASSFVAPILKKVKSFDGLEIPYFLFLPKNGKPPYKTIVFFHGGPEGQFRPVFAAQIQYYLSKGIAVVAPNVRGSSGYGRTYMNLDNYKLRLNSVKDGNAVTKDLVKSGVSKAGEFIAMGGSYGGFMVVASMAQFSDDYICGIDNVGVVDLINFLENTAGYRRGLREAEYGPLTDKEFLRSISPTNMVDKIGGELYVFHGANDPRVPISDAYILIDKMEKAGKKARFHLFEDEGHGYKKKENRKIYFSKSANFIEESCNR